MLNIDVRCTSTQDGRRNDIRKGDVDPVLGALQAFPKECRGAIWQAVKRSLTTLRKELAKSIGEVSYIKKGVIMDSISRVQRYGSSRAGSRKETNSDVVMGYINVSSRQLPLEVYKLRPNRPTHPKGRSRNMSLSGYQIGPREPVRYKKRTSDRSAGFVVKGKKGLHFLIGLRGKYHRAPDGRLHQNLIRATGYSVQYFANFDSVYQPIEQTLKQLFIERLNHEVQFRLDRLGKGK